MWLYMCTCVLLFNIVKSAEVHNQPTKKDKNDTATKTEAIFADVIKNISQVNNVLQELISNYEQLKKIYQSQENVASAYSDSEIDEVFKSKKNKQSKYEKNTRKQQKLDQFAVTQMFWSDNEEEEDDDDDDNVEDDSKDVKKTENIIEKEKQIYIKKVEPKSLLTTKTTTLKPKSSVEVKDSQSSDSSASKEKINKPNNKLKTAKSTLSVVKPTQPTVEVIFIATHKQLKQVNDKTKKPKEAKSKIESDIEFAVIPSQTKTRYNTVSLKKPVNPNLQKKPNIGLNNTKKVTQIVYSEYFAPKKIWDDIINNKPIQLEAHNKITFKKVNETAIMRSNKKGKAALVVLNKSKKDKNKEDSIPSDIDDIIEENETKALRQAYGDACTKLVMRKCYKACKQVLKTACQDVYCKSAAKSAFRSNAKTGCIREFEGKPDEGNESQTKPKHRRAPQASLSDRTMDYFDRNDNSLVNMTRSGFAAACLPHMDHKVKALRNNTQPALKNNPENFNILRDRFERACKKISSGKCNNACKYAFENMCESHKCSKIKIKVFKKTCKKECKKAYQLYDTDTSDNTSESDFYSSDNQHSDDYYE